MDEVGEVGEEVEGPGWGSRDQGDKSDVGGEFAQGARAAEGTLSFDSLLSDESDWGAWTMLKPPYFLTKHNDSIKALYNSKLGSLTPMEDVKLATVEDGTRMFCMLQRKLL